MPSSPFRSAVTARTVMPVPTSRPPTYMPWVALSLMTTFSMLLRGAVSRIAPFCGTLVA